MTDKKHLESTARWRKTKRGLITNLYNKMKYRWNVDFDLEYLHVFSKCKRFDRLFKEWENSNYNKLLKPSIDRISNKKEYTKDNIQWLTWGENRYKQNMERRTRKGEVVQILDNHVINVFKSQREAVLKTGISQSNMSSVLNKKRPKSGGYKWVYLSEIKNNQLVFENPELLNP